MSDTSSYPISPAPTVSSLQHPMSSFFYHREHQPKKQRVFVFFFNKTIYTSLLNKSSTVPQQVSQQRCQDLLHPVTPVQWAAHTCFSPVYSSVGITLRRQNLEDPFDKTHSALIVTIKTKFYRVFPVQMYWSTAYLMSCRIIYPAQLSSNLCNIRQSH